MNHYWSCQSTVTGVTWMPRYDNVPLEDMRNIVFSIKIVDTHEHLPPEEERIRTKVDALSFFVNSGAQRDDLFSSGISPEDYSFVCNPKIPIRDRWPRFEPYLEKISNTCCTKAFKIAIRDIYGVEDLSAESFVKLNGRAKEAKKKGFYEWFCAIRLR